MTTKFNFDIPTRYDEATADEGVWFEVYDEHKNHWGDFKCAYTDPYSSKTKQLNQRYRTKYAKEIRTGTLDAEDFSLDIFLDVTLKDWRGVKSQGKDIPYSLEAARAYFSTKGTKFVFNALVGYADDVTNFNIVNVDDAAGN